MTDEDRSTKVRLYVFFARVIFAIIYIIFTTYTTQFPLFVGHTFVLACYAQTRSSGGQLDQFSITIEIAQNHDVKEQW